MKKYISGAILALAFAVVSPEMAFGQWDYNSNILDNIVLDKAARRRTEGRSKGSKSGRKTTANGKASSARKPDAPAAIKYPRYGFTITSDSYQDFHREDINGFRVNFTFVPVGTGRTISKFDFLKLYDIESLIEEIPPGVYNLRAEAVYMGKTYPAHIGTREGSTDNRRGGDFASSIRVQIKPEINEYGQHVMNVSPERLYVRVIE